MSKGNAAAVRVKVEQEPDAPVERNVLARAIVDIAQAVQALTRDGLNRRAVVVLTAHSSGQSQATVKDVLGALEQLDREYVSR